MSYLRGKRLAKALDYILEHNHSHADFSLMWNVWAMAGHNDEFMQMMAVFYCKYRENFSDLIADCSPDMKKRKRQEIAAIAVSVLEGVSLITGHGKPEHPELKRLDTTIRDTILKLVYDG